MTETMQSYPEWKIIVWRYVRVFLGGFLVSLPFDQLFLANNDVIISLVRSATIAGVVALGKLLRDELAQDIPAIKRLPF